MHPVSFEVCDGVGANRQARSYVSSKGRSTAGPNLPPKPPSVTPRAPKAGQ